MLDNKLLVFITNILVSNTFFFSYNFYGQKKSKMRNGILVSASNIFKI